MAVVTLIVSILGGVFIAAPFIDPSLFPIAWVSLLPLFWVLRRCRNLTQVFFFGWIMGITTNLVGFYWLDQTIEVFGGFSPGASALIFVLFAVLEGLQIAIFSLLVRLCGCGPLKLFPAFFWVALEFWYPFLFPWHLANSQSAFLLLIQSGDIVGPYGTSFLLVWLNTIIGTGLFYPERNSRRTYRQVAAFSAVAILTLFYGHFRLLTVADKMEAAPKLPLAAIQGNIGILQKWDPDQLKDNLQSYQDLTEKAQGITLVIWPESAIENWLPENIRKLPRELTSPLQPGARFFIFGARSFRGKPGKGKPKLKAFNSVFLADRGGVVLGHYHKQVLLAFGEYVPFAPILSRFSLVPKMGDGFSRGEGQGTLNLSGAIKIAPLICYEDLMPELSRRFVAESGANLLINLTNDAWYGHTVAPWQHARLALWRAVETRRSLVRVTNTGLTAVISADGRMLKHLPIFTAGVLTAKVSLMEGKTLYVRFGDWFAWVITLIALGLLVRHWRTPSPDR